jgi:hypothetical protein
MTISRTSGTDAASSARGIGDRGTSDRGTTGRRPEARKAAPTRVAEGPQQKDKAKANPKDKSKTPIVVPPTTEVRLHFYLSQKQTSEVYRDWLDYDYEMGGIGLGSFTTAGLAIRIFTNAKTGVADFKKSLSVPGAIVVYEGHTSGYFDDTKKFVATGLDPASTRKPAVTKSQLNALLEKASANIVILAGCSSNVLVTKPLKNDIVTLVTDSGRDGLTNSYNWTRAVSAFLFALVGLQFDGNKVTVRKSRATVDGAIADGNPMLPGGDKLIRVSGDGTFAL